MNRNSKIYKNAITELNSILINESFMVSRKPTFENFFLGSKADFSFISSEKSAFDVLPFDVKHSPKSNSKYKFDYENRLVYRFSNHWQVVASCLWYLRGQDFDYGNKSEQYTQMPSALGVCKLEDFIVSDIYDEAAFEIERNKAKNITDKFLFLLEDEKLSYEFAKIFKKIDSKFCIFNEEITERINNILEC